LYQYSVQLPCLERVFRGSANFLPGHGFLLPQNVNGLKLPQ
jgi:hypothetical protein